VKTLRGKLLKPSVSEMKLNNSLYALYVLGKPRHLFGGSFEKRYFSRTQIDPYIPDMHPTVMGNNWKRFV
jgi:hypothetical protein